MRNARAALTTISADALGRVAMMVLSLASARLMEPFDLGTLGLAVIVVGFVSMFGSFPETAAIVADDIQDDDRRAGAGLVVRLVATLAGTAVVFFFLNEMTMLFGGGAFGADRVRGLTTLLLWQPWIETVAAYPRILLRRRGDFGYLAWVGLFGTGILVGTSIPLLVTGFGPEGVVYGQLLSSTSSTALIWFRMRFHSERDGDIADGPDVQKVSGAAVRLFAGGSGGYLSERLDNLFVAANLGPTQLSFYSVAWNLSRIPTNIINQAVFNVVIPSIATDKADASRVLETLRNAFRFSHLVMSLGGALLFFVVPGLIPGLIGSKWLPLTPMFQVLAFGFAVIPIQSAAAGYLISRGRAHQIGLVSVVHIIVQALCIPPACARWGVVGAAYVDVGNSALVSALLCSLVLANGGSLRWIDWWGAARLTASAVLGAAVAVTVVPPNTFFGALAGGALSLILFPLIGMAFGSRAIFTETTSLIARWMNFQVPRLTRPS